MYIVIIAINFMLNQFYTIQRAGWLLRVHTSSFIASWIQKKTHLHTNFRCSWLVLGNERIF